MLMLKDADAKKVEKEAKAKKSDKVSESKAEQSPRIVRPVRRSTLKPLDQNNKKHWKTMYSLNSTKHIKHQKRSKTMVLCTGETINCM